MNFLKDKRKRKIFDTAASIVLGLAIIAGACAGYVGDYYRTDQEAVEAFAPMNVVSTELLEDGTRVFKPESATKGFVFYPGGKVEYTAYQPLMAACAQQGILCILVEMPFNLAVFDINVVYVIILFLLIGVATEFLFPGKPALDPAAINADEKESSKKDKE